jgi:hypothetical protein
MPPWRGGIVMRYHSNILDKPPSPTPAFSPESHHPWMLPEPAKPQPQQAALDI